MEAKNVIDKEVRLNIKCVVMGLLSNLKAQQFKYKDIASALGVSLSTVQSWNSGRGCKIPSKERFLKLVLAEYSLAFISPQERECFTKSHLIKEALAAPVPNSIYNLLDIRPMQIQVLSEQLRRHVGLPWERLIKKVERKLNSHNRIEWGVAYG